MGIISFVFGRRVGDFDCRLYLDPGCPTFFVASTHTHVGQSPQRKDMSGPGKVQGLGGVDEFGRLGQ